MRWRRRTVLCRQAVDLMTDYLDGVLSGPDRRRLDAHLAGCPHCAEYLAQIRTTIAAVGRIEPEALSATARDDLVALYRAWSAG